MAEVLEVFYNLLTAVKQKYPPSANQISLKSGNINYVKHKPKVLCNFFICHSYDARIIANVIRKSRKNDAIFDAIIHEFASIKPQFFVLTTLRRNCFILRGKCPSVRRSYNAFSTIGCVDFWVLRPCFNYYLEVRSM